VSRLLAAEPSREDRLVKGCGATRQFTAHLRNQELAHRSLESASLRRELLGDKILGSCLLLLGFCLFVLKILRIATEHPLSPLQGRLVRLVDLELVDRVLVVRELLPQAGVVDALLDLLADFIFSFRMLEPLEFCSFEALGHLYVPKILHTDRVLHGDVRRLVGLWHAHEHRLLKDPTD